MFRQSIAVHPTPRSISNIWNHRRLGPRGLLADLQWAAEVLRVNHEIITDFLNVERIFNSSYLVGDWDCCLSALNKLEESHGLSFWLISRRIIINKRAASPPEDDYASTLIASAKDGTLAGWLVYMMSIREDPNITPANYVREVDSSLKNSELLNSIVKFLKYHALSQLPSTPEEAASILAVSETAPIIDRYIAWLDASQFISCEFAFSSPERKILARSVRRLAEIVPDDRLTLLDQVNSPEKISALVGRVRTKNADLYTVGDYTGFVASLSQVLRENPESTNLYSFLARATLRTDARPDLPERVLAIVRTMAAIQIFSHEEDPGAVELLRESLSGAHRLLSASIRCLYAGLGEDPSASTMNASIEALNGSTLSPLQLRNLPVEDRRALLAHAREVHPDSIALELQAAVLEFGTNELCASLRERLPADRGDLYAARALLRISQLSEPPRVCRRPFGLSYAAMAGWSSVA